MPIKFCRFGGKTWEHGAPAGFEYRWLARSTDDPSQQPLPHKDPSTLISPCTTARSCPHHTTSTGPHIGRAATEPKMAKTSATEPNTSGQDDNAEPVWTSAQEGVLQRLLLAHTNHRLHHAYILADRSGALASAVMNRFVNACLCANSCSRCPTCMQLSAATHPNVIHIDGRQEVIKIDTIRNMRKVIGHTTNAGTRRFVLIRGADSMNTSAQNALLKTLEEPPGSLVFLLSTRRLAALLPTIRSRCQSLPLASPPLNECMSILSTAGIPADLLEPLALMVGADPHRAHTLVDLNAEALWRDLGAACRGALRNNSSAALTLAADMASSAERLQLGIALLEILQSQALAAKHTTQPPADDFIINTGIIDAIRHYRQKQAFNPNRVMVAESLLLPLTTV